MRQINDFYDLMNYFSVSGNSVEWDEFLKFWISLSEMEKRYYLCAPLV